ncbi:S8 family peptidase [Demequina aurantiaca]|uniref:S8 family peptidase n=1 Tax=Demequina aurantiaca TaxID=676200 RepID=UPI0007810302|nr:S8/S53 family peptidase [Demequina aurantiaca]
MPHRFSPRLALVSVLTFAVTVGVGLPASASIVDDGEYYIDLYKIDDYHDQGIDGTGVTVAIIDGGINTAVPALQGADLTVMPDSLCRDESGDLQKVNTDDLHVASHGTNIALKILGDGKGYPGQDGLTGVAPGASVLFYGFGVDIEDPCYDSDGANNYYIADAVAAGIVDAVDNGARIISMSFAIGGSQALTDALTYAISRGVVVAVSTSNDTDDLGINETFNFFNGVLGVGAFGPGGKPALDSDGQPNMTQFIDVVAPGVDVALQGDDGAWDRQRIGSGTSYATPITVGNLALAMQKTPAATNNQILQLLIHNTDVESPHEPYYDPTFVNGYGSVDTISLLSDDPLQYPDTNPFITEDGEPTPAQLELTPASTPSPSASASAVSTPDPTPSASPSATPTPTDDATSTAWPWPLVIAIVALVVIAGIVVTVVVVRRSQKESS